MLYWLYFYFVIKYQYIQNYNLLIHAYYAAKFLEVYRYAHWNSRITIPTKCFYYMYLLSYIITIYVYRISWTKEILNYCKIVLFT